MLVRRVDSFGEKINYQCMICGGTIALEVYHKRALMNSLGNLATLCNREAGTDK